MHELAITRGIIELCERHAGGRKVMSVTVEIGALSGVVAEAVEFAFAPCAEGTVVEGATLLVERIPGRGRCRRCGTEAAVAALFASCPSCGEWGLDITAGEEMRVRELEVD